MAGEQVDVRPGSYPWNVRRRMK